MTWILVIVLFLALVGQTIAVSGVAAATFYESYPRCCCGQGAKFSPKGPNCDVNAVDNIEECTENSGCKYQGSFAAIGHQSLEYVQNNNLLAFFDVNDPNGINFQKNYGKKNILITAGSVSFNATIADTCADSDCNGCCTRNAKAQRVSYLTDLEYYTVLRYFGSYDNLPSKINFAVL